MHNRACICIHGCEWYNLTYMIVLKIWTRMITYETCVYKMQCHCCTCNWYDAHNVWRKCVLSCVCTNVWVLLWHCTCISAGNIHITECICCHQCIWEYTCCPQCTMRWYVCGSMYNMYSLAQYISFTPDLCASRDHYHLQFKKASIPK